MNKNKLTTDIFSNPKCPKWAKYAAVDAMGCVYVYYSKPSIYEDKEQGIRIWCNSNVSPIASTSSIGPTKYISDNYESSDWEHSLVERTEGWEPLPLFTADVFKQPMCPDCAKYVAVDITGAAYFYVKCPKIVKSSCTWSDDFTLDLFLGYFYSPDWKNSLIKRPVSEIINEHDWKYNKDCIVCQQCERCKKINLSYDIFNHSECPKWARYVTVDSMGWAVAHYNKPTVYLETWKAKKGPRRWIDFGYDFTDWEHTIVERTEGWEPLEKLTVDIFSSPVCPDCAKYAAVDKDGTTMFYRKKPTIDKYYGYWGDNDNVQLFVGYFDYSDWKNSLVKRPDHLTVDVSNWRYNKKCIVCKNCKLCEILQDSYEIDY